MQSRIEGKHATYRFDSLRELGTYAGRKDNRTWRYNSSESDGKSYDWDLKAGYEGAVDMARHGWLDGAKKVQKALKAFTPADAAPDTRTDFYGYRPHVARFCAGAPDCMVRKNADESGFSKVLTLVVQVNALGFVTAQQMSNFGVAVAQYVNQLEMEGRRVELMACMVSDVMGWCVAHSWTVKNADQPLDLAVVAFAIGHPAMFRRLGFALRERCAAPATPGYGNTKPAKASDIINAPDGAVILTGMTQADIHANTPQAGLAYVEKQIEKLIKEQGL